MAASPATGHAGWLCTYYVYDETNRLRTVIPPKAVEALNNGTVNWNLAANTAINTGLCYNYYYDNRGRVIMKRIPGKGKQYIAYDLLDRVVMTQDSNLRLTNQWAFIKYDGMSRVIKSGLITSALIKDSIWAQAARNSDYPTLSGTYTVTGEIYYDDYAWIAATGAPVSSTLVTTNITSTNFNTTYNTYPEYAQSLTASNRIRGAVTGSKRIIVGTANYLYSVPIYDDHGRVIQAKETNYTGGTDVLTKQYRFNGQLLRTHLQHQKNGNNAQSHTLLNRYSYDHTGRLKNLVKNIDGLGDKTISQLTYNELGQVQTKVFGASLETQTLAYNIRGWLTSINKSYIDNAGSTSNYFGEALSYDFGFTNNQYNGNIAGLKWKAYGDGIARAYGFTYDNANRLTVAEFSQQNQGATAWTNDKADFTTNNLSYDAAGNILTMKQRGLKISTVATVDSLTYQYFSNTNQLQKVSDGISDNSPLGDFKDTALATDDYAYDVNGNITKDNNRHMHTAANGNGAVYNFLDRPDSLVIKGKATLYYYYDAAGTKLRKKINDYTAGGSPVVKDYLYINGFVYLNDTLQYAAQEEGRIRWAKKKNSTTGVTYYAFEYDYYLRDHLGNVRTVLTEGKDTTTYAASMETADSAVVRALFSNVYDPVRTVTAKPTGFDTDNNNQKVSTLNASTGVNKKLGPSIVLKVMAGDQVQLNTYAWYNTPVQSPPPGVDLASDIINILANSVIGNSGGKLTTGDVSGVSSALSPGLGNFLTNGRSYDNTKPKAYLTWVLFDNQFNYVAGNSGVQQVQAGSSKQALVAPLQTISKNGYLYVYVSNESQQDVYFDDLTVKHTTGPLQQEQSYYAFGLQMAGISDKALLKKSTTDKFNGGVELEEDYGVNLYNTFFRQYDPQIGRFNGVDILSEETYGINPYQFGFNNGIMFNDPTGALTNAEFSNIVNELLTSSNGGHWNSSSGIHFFSDVEANEITELGKSGFLSTQVTGGYGYGGISSENLNAALNAISKGEPVRISSSIILNDKSSSGQKAYWIGDLSLHYSFQVSFDKNSGKISSLKLETNTAYLTQSGFHLYNVSLDGTLEPRIVTTGKKLTTLDGSQIFSKEYEGNRLMFHFNINIHTEFMKFDVLLKVKYNLDITMSYPVFKSDKVFNWHNVDVNSLEALKYLTENNIEWRSIK